MRAVIRQPFFCVPDFVPDVVPDVVWRRHPHGAACPTGREERLRGLQPEEVLQALDPAVIEAWLAKQRQDH